MHHNQITFEGSVLTKKPSLKNNLKELKKKSKQRIKFYLIVSRRKRNLWNKLLFSIN